jgi:hypothetical protein
VEKQQRVAGDEEPTGAYFLQDLYLNGAWKDWEAKLRLSNIYDRKYRRPGSAIDEVERDIRFHLSYLF